MKYLNNVDLTKNQLLNAVVQNLASAPASPVEGLIYQNTTDHKFYYYNGTGWIPLVGIYVHPNHSGDVTSAGDGAQTIANDAVSNAKAANMAANTIKGRITASTGDPEDLTAANVRTIINVADGANAYAHPNHSGDVTSVGDGAQTIANGAVSLAKMANLATQTVIGRNTAGTGVPEALSMATLKAMLSATAKYATTIAGLATSEVITHNLNTRDVTVMLYEVAAPYAKVMCDVEMTTVNSITLGFASAPTAGQYRVVVVG